ncbi:MAG: hypothetical protein PHG41_05105 [Actinomycetota bacterium]|jgi:hypothetical protein|nr:hypothetical protein [Actinomycetota bacterium]
MRNKIFYVSAFLILALLLSSCTGGKPTVPEMPTDEELIRGVIKEFFSALSEQKWKLAKSKCVHGDNAYKLVDNLENVVASLSYKCNNNVTLNYWPDITDIVIDGTDAHAHGYLAIVLKCDGQVDPNHSRAGNGDISLQKIGSNWKLLKMEPIK